MSIVDLSAVQSIIEEVAATEIMPRFRRLQQGDVEIKDVDDPVTVADKAAEEALSKRLTGILPGSTVVGEETCSDDPYILGRFASDGDVWVIDPIDGTRNFIEGRREFGVMVACVRRKETIAAWIHDPNSGHTLSAEKGSGVWMQRKKMRLAARDPACKKLMIIGSRLRSIVDKPHLANAIAALPCLAIGSAVAFDYARLFTGDVCFGNSAAPRATALLYRISKPWDHVPGLFLHAEAGGYAATLYGKPYDLQIDKNGLLIAQDKDIWATLHSTIKPVIGELIQAERDRDELARSKMRTEDKVTAKSVVTAMNQQTSEAVSTIRTM